MIIAERVGGELGGTSRQMQEGVRVSQTDRAERSDRRLEEVGMVVAVVEGGAWEGAGGEAYLLPLFMCPFLIPDGR